MSTSDLSRDEAANLVGVSVPVWSMLVTEGLAPEAVQWRGAEPRWAVTDVLAWDVPVKSA